jgi:PhoH-like ATPase
VLDELDDAKVRPDEVGRNARSIVRMLDELRSKGSLSEGVKLNNSIIRVELNHSNNIPNGLSIDKKDNRIISVSIGLKKDNPLDSIIVVTKDINMRVKCDALGIEAQDYNKDKIATDLESIYSGVQTLDVSSNLINALYEDGFTFIEDL